MKQQDLSEGELYILSPLSKRYYSSTTKVHPHLINSISRTSYSTERVMKMNDKEKRDLTVLSPVVISRSNSEKMKKKVSFRKPKEPDIFIFYSPEEKLEE
ncbi:hypothetical protein FRX31_031956 [Thalictrum thalictroides]|uniref:Uncharacterized protein n=1 Tax=Thalictrum thalictroides TaxID=46969 RepID=A0A7J6V0J6_THATH|nr:hypothetical protein FRX31_031956 [Thalictrum thalictroides]